MNLSFWDYLRHGSALDPMSRNFKDGGSLRYQTDVINFVNTDNYDYAGKIQYTNEFTRDNCIIDDHVIVKTVPQNVRQEKIAYWHQRFVQTCMMTVIGGIPSFSVLILSLFRKILYGASASWFTTALMTIGLAAAILGAYRCIEAREEKGSWENCIENYEGGIAKNRITAGKMKDHAERFLYVRNGDLACIAFSAAEVLGFWKNWVADLVKDYRDFTPYTSAANRKSIIDNFFQNNPFQATSLTCAFQTTQGKKGSGIPPKENLFQAKFADLNDAYKTLTDNSEKELKNIGKVQKEYLKSVANLVDGIRKKLATLLKDDVENKEKIQEIVKVYQKHLDTQQTKWRQDIDAWAEKEKTHLVSTEQFITPITEFVKAIDNSSLEDQDINNLPTVKIKKMASPPHIDEKSLQPEVAFKGHDFDGKLIEQIKEVIG